PCTHRPLRSRDRARAEPCSARASRRPRRCRPSSSLSRKPLNLFVREGGACAGGASVDERLARPGRDAGNEAVKTIRPLALSEPTDLKRTAHRASVPSERFGDTVVVAPLQPLGGQAGSGSSLRSAKRVDLRG